MYKLLSLSDFPFSRKPVLPTVRNKKASKICTWIITNIVQQKKAAVLDGEAASIENVASYYFCCYYLLYIMLHWPLKEWKQKFYRTNDIKKIYNYNNLTPFF